MEYYPAFSSFRELITKWDRCLDIQEEKTMIGDQLDRHGCIMFFRRGDDLFGAPEESRLTFAKIKSEDDDITDQWRQEAKFIAINLIQALLGQTTQNLFGLKDIPGLKLIDRENAVEHLWKQKKKKKGEKKK
jgi:hypothetical protein